MKYSNAIKIIAACAILTGAMPVFAHVFLENKSAAAGSTYKAVFQIGHGCQGAATTGVSVQIPPGFQGAKPYPKAGWNLTVQIGKLVKSYVSNGKQVSEDVTVVNWTAATKDAALPEAYFDEFMLRGKLPEAAGPIWFKVLQTCESGSNNWSDVPATGTSTQGLKSPAVLLDVIGLAPQAQLSAPAAAPGKIGEHDHGQHKP